MVKMLLLLPADQTGIPVSAAVFGPGFAELMYTGTLGFADIAGIVAVIVIGMGG